MSLFDQQERAHDLKNGLLVDNLIILSRADPIICGHSTETRNLAEAARSLGIENVHIVSYPLDVLAASGLPLKPDHSVEAYSSGITVSSRSPLVIIKCSMVDLVPRSRDISLIFLQSSPEKQPSWTCIWFLTGRWLCRQYSLQAEVALPRYL